MGVLLGATRRRRPSVQDTRTPGGLDGWLRGRDGRGSGSCQRRSGSRRRCRTTEKIDQAFLGWIWGHPLRSRPRILAALVASGPERRVVILRDRSEVARFLGSPT
jgi:hypothetical protein